MTENEAIKILKYYDEQPYFFSRDASADCAFKMAIQALEEIQSYRAIGTVEDIREIYSLCKILQNVVKDYSAIGTIEEFKALKEKNTPNPHYCKCGGYISKYNGYRCTECGALHAIID